MNKKQEYDASDIQVLEGLEPVRKRPGMYIGSVNSKGVNHLLYEVLDNSIDEHLAGYCTEIQVFLNKDGSATVIDNGRGIPVDMHKKGVTAERVILTTLHAGGKFNNNAYKVAGGLHGVGSSVVNALSSWMDIKIKKDGAIHHDRYEKGVPVVKLIDGLLPKGGKTKETGTEISFMPDIEIFGNNTFKPAVIKDRLHEIAYLNPGLKIFYTDYTSDKNENLIFHEETGLIGYMKELAEGKETISSIIPFNGQFENIFVEGVIQFVNSFDETILGFCNNINTTEGGMHITGFKNRFTLLINSYARELGILKDKDENYTGADTRSGLIGIITIKHPDPLFEGQTKTKLGSADAAKAVSNILGEKLTLYFDKNLEELKRIINNAERSAKIRKAETKNKANILEKQRFSFEGNGKLSNCESKDASKCEIFIVEGDSAGGSAKMARNRKYQAIMPIRGKILNVEKATMDRILRNEEIKSMINAFGCGMSEGYGNDFDIEKLKYNKIVIMADADVDGAHIGTLLLTFFYRFMPDLIKEGHIFKAMPPLYKVTPSKGKPLYLYDDAALAEYKKTHKGNFGLQRYKGLGEMSPNQLWETTMDPANRMLKQIEIDDAISASKMTELLMGNNIEARREFIYENALSADLDL